MSNINVVKCNSCLEFLGDYEIESVEVKTGDELTGDAIIRLLIENEEYELRVSMKEGKKEGIGLFVREKGTLLMKLMFVKDLAEGQMVKIDKHGRTVLRGDLKQGKEYGLFKEFNIWKRWRGLYRNGKRYMTLKEQEGKDSIQK